MVQLVTVQKAAARLDVHEDTVRRLIQRGELAASRIGRSVRVDVADLEALVARRRLGKAPERTDDMISVGQGAALHAKCNELDRLQELEKRTTHDLVLVEASGLFDRALSSFTELTRGEASRLLDRLEERVLEMKRRVGASA